MNLPDQIKVVRHGGAVYVEVDGRAFPYPIAEEPISTEVSKSGLPTITLTLAARSVQVHDSVEHRVGSGS
ncbi:MAG: hypothetical protein M3355_12000 [Actinomycetota bacterium]|nr:hypothetical protein [Actinomycetota bacterium]